MRKDLRPDPNNLLPIVDHEVFRLGLGVRTAHELEALFRAYPPAPPVLKISNKNFILEGDRDAFRARLIKQALEAHGGHNES